MAGILSVLASYLEKSELTSATASAFVANTCSFGGYLNSRRLVVFGVGSVNGLVHIDSGMIAYFGFLQVQTKCNVK